MIVFTCFVLNNDNRERFLEESFLLAHIKLDIILKLLFFIITNANINFKVQDL